MSTTADPGAASPAVNFTHAVRDAPFGLRQAVVIAILGLLVLFDGMDTQILGLIARDMTRDLQLPISAFGLVFSAGLVGGLIGSVVMSPLADRWLGRKAIAISAMALAGLATLATPLASDLTSLLGVRLLAGVGLGAALPSIFALASEFSPARLSRRVTASLVAFAPLGSFVGGMIGRTIVPTFGWEMLLFVSGGLTLVLTVFAAWRLPESVQFLLTVRQDARRAGVAARRYLPGLAVGVLSVDVADAGAAKKQPVGRLFSGGLWKFTLLVWVAFILNQGTIYFALGWTPALLQKSGLATASGMDAAAMFGLGGALGTAAQGWLATRFNIYRLMLAEVALYVAGFLVLPFILTNPLLAPVTVFVIAAGVCACHSGFILILMETYPADVRTTGFGWAFGIGRFGATSAPIVAGALVGAGWTSQHIFAAAAIPGVVSALALTGIAILLRRRRDGGGDAPAEQEPSRSARAQPFAPQE